MSPSSCRSITSRDTCAEIDGSAMRWSCPVLRSSSSSSTTARPTAPARRPAIEGIRLMQFANNRGRARPQGRDARRAGPGRRVDRRRHDVPERRDPGAGQGDGRLRPGGRRADVRAGNRQGLPGPGEVVHPEVGDLPGGAPIPDLNSGLRAFRRDVALQYVHLLPAGFSCVSTITMMFLAHGYTVKYLPMSTTSARAPRSSTGGTTRSAT